MGLPHEVLRQPRHGGDAAEAEQGRDAVDADVPLSVIS